MAVYPEYKFCYVHVYCFLAYKLVRFMYALCAIAIASVSDLCYLLSLFINKNVPYNMKYRELIL